MKLLTDAKEFINTLKRTSKVSYQSNNLKAIVKRIEEKNSKRQLLIKYFYWGGLNWIGFSEFASHSVQDIINDFKTEQEIYDK